MPMLRFVERPLERIAPLNERLVEPGRASTGTATAFPVAGVTETAAIVGDHPVAGREQDALLLLPGRTVERVPVNEHDRAAAAVVLVEDVDGVAVFATTLSFAIAEVLFGAGAGGIGRLTL